MDTRLIYEDKVMFSYIYSLDSEYGDDILKYDSRIDMYWNLSSIRKYTFLSYPIEKEATVLMVGDRYGALVGGICDKIDNLDILVPTEQHADVIRYRYRDRNNVNIYVEGMEIRDKIYEYIAINLDFIGPFYINDYYEVDKLIRPVLRYLTEDGKLLLICRGDWEECIIKILYNLGFSYTKECDPIGNGSVLIEACKEKSNKSWDIQFPAPIIDDKWIRRYGVPYMGGVIQDQDSKMISQVLNVQLDLLRKLLDVCTTENLQVYPMYGTLLGIVRDGGMISGDDDIDVAMPRKDFNKLIELADDFTEMYFLQTPYNDECFWGGYLKLRNTKTTAIHPQNFWTDACEGISIDIFPLDYCFVNSKREKRKRNQIRFYQRILYAKTYGYFKQFKDMPFLVWKGYKYFGKLFHKKKLVDRLYQTMCLGDKNSNQYAIYTHYGNNCVRYMEKEAFSSTIQLLYEGIRMEVPVGWEALLKKLYGENFWERKNFVEYKKRHGFYDCFKPYAIYKEKFGGLNNPEQIKEKVIILGDGSLFNVCAERYRDKIEIEYMVLLPGETEKSVSGVKVISWDDFIKMDILNEESRLVICSANVRKTIDIVTRAGIKEYYIYWYDREWMLYANQTQIWQEINRINS